MSGGGPGIGTVNNWAGGTATMLLGLNQYYKGKKMLKNNQRPTYSIPDEVRQNLTQAQQDALQGLPEEQRQMFLSNIQRGSAMGLNQLSGRKAGIAGVAALNQNQNDAYANLLSMDSQARMQNKGILMNQRQNMADYKDQAFQINKLNPYYEKQAEGLAMKGAGMQNLANGYQIAGSGSASNSANPDTGGGVGGGMGNQMTAGRNYSQGIQMDPNQMQGVNQNTTPNPYAGQKEVNMSNYGGGSYWG